MQLSHGLKWQQKDCTDCMQTLHCLSSGSGAALQASCFGDKATVYRLTRRSAASLAHWKLLRKFRVALSSHTGTCAEGIFVSAAVYLQCYHLGKPAWQAVAELGRGYHSQIKNCLSMKLTSVTCARSSASSSHSLMTSSTVQGLFHTQGQRVPQKQFLGCLGPEGCLGPPL